MQRSKPAPHILSLCVCVCVADAAGSFPARGQVVTADGQTYERRAIAFWLKDHTTSPSTGEELESPVLISNYTVRGLCQEARERWRDAHGGARGEAVVRRLFPRHKPQKLKPHPRC